MPLKTPFSNSKLWALFPNLRPFSQAEKSTELTTTNPRAKARELVRSKWRPCLRIYQSCRCAGDYVIRRARAHSRVTLFLRLGLSRARCMHLRRTMRTCRNVAAVAGEGGLNLPRKSDGRKTEQRARIFRANVRNVKYPPRDRGSQITTLTPRVLDARSCECVYADWKALFDISMKTHWASRFIANFTYVLFCLVRIILNYWFLR